MSRLLLCVASVVVCSSGCWFLVVCRVYLLLFLLVVSFVLCSNVVSSLLFCFLSLLLSVVCLLLVSFELGVG